MIYGSDGDSCWQWATAAPHCFYAVLVVVVVGNHCRRLQRTDLCCHSPLTTERQVWQGTPVDSTAAADDVDDDDRRSPLCANEREVAPWR